MKKYLSIVLSVFLLISCSKTDDEYKKYSKFIRNEFAINKRVIAVSNKTVFISECNNFKWLSEVLPSMKKETFDDFIKKNTDTFTVINHFRTSRKIILVDQKELSESFIKYNFWDEFYKKYSKAQGILSFSKVGFDLDRTQALVYVKDSRDWLGASGSMILYKKKAGLWIKSYRIVMWMA